MKDWFRSLLSPDDRVSSKRVVTLTAAVLLYVSFLADLFWTVEINNSIYDGMLYLAMAGLGTTALEKVTFARKKEPEPTIIEAPSN